jgi:hypothetical protein
MPHLEAPVEASLAAVGDPLADVLPWLELRDVLRQTLQIGEVSSALGWPRVCDAELAQRTFASPSVVCTFADVSAFEPPPAFVVLPTDQAVALADLCLGGEGRASVPGAAGVPHDAECGVLAYLAARCVRICAPTLRLRDVSVDRVSARLAPEVSLLRWPMRVKLGATLELQLSLLVSMQSALAQQLRRVSVAIREELDAGALGALSPGDLLVCEGWPGCFTALGVAGCVELSVAGLREPLMAALEGGKLRALRDGSATATRHGEARLVLADVDASLADLAELAADRRELLLPPLERGYLQRTGQTIARGSLVRYGGALALEVGELPSMR